MIMLRRMAMATFSLGGVVSCACFMVLMIACSSDASKQGRLGRHIVVGGKEQWRFGYNYSSWATKAAPFYVGDTLVFKYEPSVLNGMEVNNNVYSLHNMEAYKQCVFGRSRLLANTTQGNPGYQFVLTQRGKPVYFACGIAQGIHCNEGLMKFWVNPR